MTDPVAPQDCRLPQQVLSVTEVVAAARCEFGAVRRREVALGWRVPPCGAQSVAHCTDDGCDTHHDAMSQRLSALGDAFEAEVIAALIAEHGLWQPGAPRWGLAGGGVA